jgi:hypothetical protein
MASERSDDTEVLPPRRFITHTARTCTLRGLVKARVRDRQHWVILCTPDCGVPALRLEALHRERCGETMEVVFLNSLPYCPAVFFFPREHLKPRHDRVCWLTQKRAEKRADTQRSKVRETKPISLVTRTPLALEIGHRDLTNRVTASVTPVCT